MTTRTVTPLDGKLASLLARRDSRGLLRRLTISDTNLTDFSSNDYLSLSRHPEISRAYLTHLQGLILNHGGKSEFSLGSGGSRLLDGNTELAENLEGSLAKFHDSEAALLFNSGYEANTGLLSSVPQVGDVVLYDEAIHASIHSGIKLSRAGLRLAFKHNHVWNKSHSGEQKEECSLGTNGNLKSLDGVLRQISNGNEGTDIKEGLRHVFVVVEAIYSMDGDVAPLQDIVDCVDMHFPRGNGLVIVDEAHSNGILGERGRGLVCELGLERRIWARVLTFGKALGCSGAVVLCSAITRSYLVNYARTFIYTTAMGLPGLLSIQLAHDYIASGKADALRCRMRTNIGHVYTRLREICRQHDPTGSVISLKFRACQSPIIPVFTGRAKSLAQFCQGHGFMVRAIVAPTVPLGTDRVRICIHAGNSEADCVGLCDSIEAWVLRHRKVGDNEHFPALEARRGDSVVLKHKL